MGKIEINKTSADLVPVEADLKPGTTDLGELGLAGYSAPEGYEGKDLADGELSKGRRKILYLGEKAIVDVIDGGFMVGEVEVPETLLLRVEGQRDQAIEVFRFPQRFVPEADARRVFGEAA